MGTKTEKKPTKKVTKTKTKVSHFKI